MPFFFAVEVVPWVVEEVALLVTISNRRFLKNKTRTLSLKPARAKTIKATAKNTTVLRKMRGVLVSSSFGKYVPCGYSPSLNHETCYLFQTVLLAYFCDNGGRKLFLIKGTRVARKEGVPSGVSLSDLELTSFFDLDAGPGSLS
jgi:hypothetical protein